MGAYAAKIEKFGTYAFILLVVSTLTMTIARYVN